jgi:hypothetical protein
MRASNTILSSLILSAVLSGAAIAAPAKAAPEADCQRVGGEVSALIDANKTAPNIAAARSSFQVGIMECMESDNTNANKHYQEAKTLLTGEQPALPASPRPAAAKAAAIEADCQRVGGDVSALIDVNRTSPNIAAARSVFQMGIMECMEGDDANANKHYQQAKTLLGSDEPKASASSPRS